MRGTSVELPAVFDVRDDVHAFVDYDATLAAVCALAGHGPRGYTLRFRLDAPPDRPVWGLVWQ